MKKYLGKAFPGKKNCSYITVITKIFMLNIYAMEGVGVLSFNTNHLLHHIFSTMQVYILNLEQGSLRFSGGGSG